jgi:cell division protein FtsL
VQLFLGIVLLLVFVVATVVVAAIGIVWINHERRHHGTSGSLGSAMLELQALIDPAKKQVLEARRQQEETEEGDETGDPPSR